MAARAKLPTYMLKKAEETEEDEQLLFEKGWAPCRGAPGPPPAELTEAKCEWYDSAHEVWCNATEEQASKPVEGDLYLDGAAPLGLQFE